MRLAVRRFVVFLSLGLMILFHTDILAGENGAVGMISGGLINGTTGERVPGVEVVLQRYEGNQEKEKQKSHSDPQGRFSFPNLNRSKGNSYRLQAVYQGVEYNSHLIAFEDQKQEIPFEMTVYETTDSDEKLSVVMHHLLAQPQDGVLWVKEVMVVENRDNRVFVGAREIAPDKKETLRISLPPRAQELQLGRGLMSCCIVDLQDGFADTMDIKPGRKEILFAYKVESGGPSLNLSKQINLKTDSLDFFIPNQGIRAGGKNIQYAGLIGKPDNQFLHFTGKGLAKGSQVVLNLKGFPWGRRFFKKMTPIFAVALVGLGLAYPLMRRRKRSSGTKMEGLQQSGGRSTLQEERQNVLWAIAELDDQLDSGRISPDEHEKKRRLLKEKAITMTETETLQHTEKS